MFSACRSQNRLSTELKGRVFCVSGEQIKIGKYISEGSYARIYETSNPRICVKHMRVQSGEQLQTAKIECQTLLTLTKSRNCLHLRGLYFDNEEYASVPPQFSEVFMFIEYCPVSLVKLLQRRLTECEALEVFKGVANGLQEMHALGLMHRDVKAENVLLTCESIEADNVRLCDFGSVSSKCYSASDLLANQQLRQSLEADFEANTTPEYRAPEMINLFSKYDITSGVDIFALGILLYRMRFGKAPFAENELLSNYNCEWTMPTAVGQMVQMLLEATLVRDPAERATALQLLEMAEQKYDPHNNIDGPKNLGCEANIIPTATSHEGTSAALPQLSYSQQLLNSQETNTQIDCIISSYVNQQDFRRELHLFLETNTVNQLYMALLQPPCANPDIRNELIRLSLCLFELICLQEAARVSIFDRYASWIAGFGAGFEAVFCFASLGRQVAVLANMVMEEHDRSGIGQQALNSVPPLNALLMLRNPDIHNFEATIVGFVCEFVANYVYSTPHGIQLYQRLYDEYQEFRVFYRISMQLEAASSFSGPQ